MRQSYPRVQIPVERPVSKSIVLVFSLLTKMLYYKVSWESAKCDIQIPILEEATSGTFILRQRSRNSHRQKECDSSHSSLTCEFSFAEDANPQHLSATCLSKYHHHKSRAGRYRFFHLLILVDLLVYQTKL